MKVNLRLSILALSLGLTSISVWSAETRWSWQNPLPQGNPLSSVAAVDANTFVAVGNTGTVIKSSDGGSTWAVQHYAGGTRADLRGVAFADANTGTAVGTSGTIIRTTDGGA